MAHLIGWLVATGRGVDALTDEVIQEYALARCAAGYRYRTTARAVSPLLGYLRGLQVAPPLVAALPVTPVEVLVSGFCDYLANERGLVAGRCTTIGVSPACSWRGALAACRGNCPISASPDPAFGDRVHVPGVGPTVTEEDRIARANPRHSRPGGLHHPGPIPPQDSRKRTPIVPWRAACHQRG